MRILVMSDLYPPHIIGGSELSCQSHAEGLQQRGHRVHVLTSWWGLDKGAVEGNVYRLLNHAPASFRARRDSNLPDPWRLRRRYGHVKRALAWSGNYKKTQVVLADVRPDVVYAWHMEGVSISPLLAAQDQGIPVVLRLTDYWLAEMKADLCLEPNALKRFYRAVLVGLGGFRRLKTSYMLAVSRSVMRSYVQAGFPVESMEVVPEGVPSDLLLDADAHELADSPHLHQDGEAKLLFAGRLVSTKGPDVAIEALAHLVGELDVRHARLDIIGDGDEEYVTQLRKMVARLGVESRVVFVGKLDHRRLLERYAQYHALLFTSRWAEPFGITLLEAMARGLPVIATNRGGPAEVISDGENGILVMPDEPVMLANAIKRLIQHPGLAQYIRHAALATVRAKYTLEHVVEQCEDYLQRVIEQSRE